MSVNGVACVCGRFGEMEASSVGKGGIGGAIEDLRPFRGEVLFRFRGEGLLDGEVGSLGARLSSGSNIWVGSIPSPVLALRALADRFGVALTLAVVCLLVDLRGLRFGAGVNSSSLSSLIRLSSSSDSSTTMVLRVARRDGRAGDSADMSTIVAFNVDVGLFRSDAGED